MQPHAYARSTMDIRRHAGGGPSGLAGKRALLVVVALAAAALSAAPTLAAATSKTVRIPFSSSGAITLETGVQTPDGPGPFPVVVLSHGDPRSTDNRPKMHPFNEYAGLRAFLVARGYAIIIPMRRGFGDSDGQYSEGYGSCDNADYVKAGRATADDINAAVRYARTQSFADATRIVLIGHSGGGFGSIAEASRHPDGVVAVVNFAGGRGSQKSDQDCDPDALVQAMATFGQQVQMPSLWIYAENDHFFPPTIAKAMFAAFVAGSPQAQFAAAPASGNDGHSLINTTTFWPDVVDAFLKKTVLPH